MKIVNGCKAWVVLAAALLLWGCASVEQFDNLDVEVYRLQTRMDAVQKEQDSFKKEIPTLKADLSAETNRIRTDVSAETKRAQGDLLLRVEKSQSDIRNLSTGVEEYRELLKKPSKDIDQVKDDMASRIKSVEDRGRTFEEKYRIQEDRARNLDEKIRGIDEKIRGIEDRLKGLDLKLERLGARQFQLESEKSAPERGEGPGESKGGPSTGAGDLYKDAYETFIKGDLEGARRKFEAFLKQYPNTELSDNSQFWIGETYYLRKDFEKAILEYERVVTNYPEGDKVPAALLKQAFAFLEIGDKANARNVLKKVIERYPQSEQAETAKKRLEALK